MSYCKNIRPTHNLAAFALCTGAAALFTATGCSDDSSTDSHSHAFSLRFVAVDGNQEIRCGDVVSGLGSNSAFRAAIGDLRFYVSNIRFFTASGEEVEVELDSDEFQYSNDKGTVALVDLTGTASGACAGNDISFPEGTARTNDAIEGETEEHEITRITFDIGMPQSLMKSTIASTTAEDAPSPLAEMYWSWATAYRHFVMNFTLEDGKGAVGEGYVHVGSTDCGGDGTRALTDRDTCGKKNTAAVVLNSFDLESDVVAVDIRQLLADLDFEVARETGAIPGVECHSSPSQPDCAAIFGTLGLDLANGNAQDALNKVFRVK